MTDKVGSVKQRRAPAMMIHVLLWLIKYARERRSRQKEGSFQVDNSARVAAVIAKPALRRRGWLLWAVVGSRERTTTGRWY